MKRALLIICVQNLLHFGRGHNFLQVGEAGKAILQCTVVLALDQGQRVINELLGHAVAVLVDPLQRYFFLIVSNG